MSALPPPLPPSARELDVVLGMTAQRVVFHYGIELEGLKYNGPELGELRRRIGSSAKVELTFDPGDLGRINVLDSQSGAYIPVPAIDQGYANGLSLWQHKVIRRYAQRQMNARTDIVALAQAKAEIRALVERDFNRKSTRGRKRHARFMQDHTGDNLSERGLNQLAPTGPPGEESASAEVSHSSPEIHPALEVATVAHTLFTDDEILPVFEAALDLPRSPIVQTPEEGTTITEDGDVRVD